MVVSLSGRIFANFNIFWRFGTKQCSTIGDYEFGKILQTSSKSLEQPLFDGLTTSPFLDPKKVMGDECFCMESLEVRSSALFEDIKCN